MAGDKHTNTLEEIIIEDDLAEAVQKTAPILLAVEQVRNMIQHDNSLSIPEALKRIKSPHSVKAVVQRAMSESTKKGPYDKFFTAKK